MTDATNATGFTPEYLDDLVKKDPVEYRKLVETATHLAGEQADRERRAKIDSLIEDKAALQRQTREIAEQIATIDAQAVALYQEGETVTVGDLKGQIVTSHRTDFKKIAADYPRDVYPDLYAEPAIDPKKVEHELAPADLAQYKSPTKPSFRVTGA